MKNVVYGLVIALLAFTVACTNAKNNGAKNPQQEKFDKYLNKTMFVNAIMGLPLKKKPALEGTRIDFLRHGASVTITEIGNPESGEGLPWAKIKAGELTGWVDLDTLAESAEACLPAEYSSKNVHGMWIKENKAKKYYDPVNIHWLNDYSLPGNGFDFREDGTLYFGDFGAGLFQGAKYEVVGKKIACFSVDDETKKRSDLFAYEILCGNEYFLTLQKDGKEETWLKWNSPMQVAAFAGDAAAVADLLAKGADINEKLSCGMTALSWAVVGGKDAVVKNLLDNGAAVDLQDNFGRTALHFAVYQAVLDPSKAGMISALLDKKADFEIVDYYWQTARDICGLNVPGFRTNISTDGYRPQGIFRDSVEKLLGLFE